MRSIFVVNESECGVEGKRVRTGKREREREKREEGRKRQTDTKRERDGGGERESKREDNVNFILEILHVKIALKFLFFFLPISCHELSK